MYLQTELIRLLKEEQERHYNLIVTLQTRQSQLPKGSLVYKNGGYYRAIKTQGKSAQIFIPENDPDGKLLIQQMKETRHIKKALPILKNNLKVYGQALDQLVVYDAARLGDKLLPHYKDFDYTPLLLNGDINPETWSKQLYPHNTNHPEDLIHESEGGLRTRSKAESQIATMLEGRNIHFRYEPRLQLGKHLYFPDFYILHPVQRKLIYWEHFGKMDDPVYVLNTIEKLRVYSEHGYRLGDNLIMTWETKDYPLTFNHIKKRIDLYFS